MSRPTSLLGGLAYCPCGAKVMAATSGGARVYHCDPRDRSAPATRHVTREQRTVDDHAVLLLGGVWQATIAGQWDCPRAERLQDDWPEMPLTERRGLVKDHLTSRGRIVVLPAPARPPIAVHWKETAGELGRPRNIASRLSWALWPLLQTAGGCVKPGTLAHAADAVDGAI